jgi:hypothetical protein
MLREGFASSTPCDTALIEDTTTHEVEVPSWIQIDLNIYDSIFSLSVNVPINTHSLLASLPQPRRLPRVLPQNIRKGRPQHLRPRLLHLRRNAHQIQDLQTLPRVFLRKLQQRIGRRRQPIVRGRERLFLLNEDARHEKLWFCQ